ncbi:hypothetical protein KJ854_03160 [Patescibacteria group bacterium]|nr:hypothetical protein [Patescibacteria group bacterium]MBU4142144.1 hypothetical protein [Patescibacteria group bacterium]
MQFKIPKNTRYLAWTKHVSRKMMFYGLSAAKVKTVLSRGDRTEPGIAPNTIAVMKKSGSKKNPQEIWVMYQDKKITQGGVSNERRVIITAWRYPGVSKPKEKIPIPEGVLSELAAEEGIEI